MKNALRIVGLLEGSSFLLLLGVGMPLKYIYGIPMASRVAGTVHGVLFLVFLGLAYSVAETERWSFRQKLHAVIASIVPLGTFWFDVKYLGTKVRGV